MNYIHIIYIYYRYNIYYIYTCVYKNYKIDKTLGSELHLLMILTLTMALLYLLFTANNELTIKCIRKRLRRATHW